MQSSNNDQRRVLFKHEIKGGLMTGFEKDGEKASLAHEKFGGGMQRM